MVGDTFGKHRVGRNPLMGPTFLTKPASIRKAVRSSREQTAGFPDKLSNQKRLDMVRQWHPIITEAIPGKRIRRSSGTIARRNQ